MNEFFKRVGFSIAFGAVCIAMGFYLAIGFQADKPSAANASGPIALPASFPLVDEEGNSPFVLVADKVSHVVVNISAEKTMTNHPPIPEDLFDLRPFFREPRGRGGRSPSVTSGGSGIIISEDGYILTNNHVVSGANKITIKFSNNSEYPAELIGSDPETDVALLKVDQSIPPEMVAKYGDSDKIRIGEWAIAIGNPFGLDWTLTVGVISARGRSNLAIGGGDAPSFQDFIQTDASINFGNSGGPLVNIKGEVIGVNTAINAQGQGIGFAIPINMARKVVDQLMISGMVKRGYLGVVPSELDDIKREALGVDKKVKGVLMESVQPETPAAKGGLKGGEVVTAINGKPVKDVTDFRFQVADYPPDSKITMTIHKNGKNSDLTFVLGDRSDYLRLASVPSTPRTAPSWLGIEVANTDGPAGERFGVSGQKGVVVTNIIQGAAADGFLIPGDLIVAIGDDEVLSVDDFRKISEDLKERKRAIPFWVMRNDSRTFIPIRP